MKSKINEIIELVLVILIISVSFVIGFCLGNLSTQKKAIEAGVAHYIVNPTNGITQFQFKTARP